MRLNDKIKRLPKVGPVYVSRLEKLGITTIKDLLLHVPSRYLDFRTKSKIKDLRPGQVATIEGQLEFIKNQYTRSGKRIQIGTVSDNTSKVLLVWFNQPFLTRTLRRGMILSVAGEVGQFGRDSAFIVPEYEIVTKSTKTHTGRMVPVYPQTNGVSSKWLRGRINLAYDLAKDKIKEFLPADEINKQNLLDYPGAIAAVHFPDTLKKAKKGRDRLAFNELLYFQIKSQLRRVIWHENEAVLKLKLDNFLYKKFVDSLPFVLTASQSKAIKEIFTDLTKKTPMNRLLEGDVGSGKTVVAAAASFVAFINGYQSVFMAPTQILAKQHFTTLKSIFDKFKLRIKLVTAEGEEGDLGKVDLFVGTHALIHKSVDFDKVAVVVIDEQHRFGVEQRAHLVEKTGKKSFAPHVLTMTATPIPRTAALTVYGDLDLSTLDELPKGRKKITTWIVPPLKRIGAYEWIKKNINKTGAQAFVICPLIDESEVESMQGVRAATQEFSELKKVFTALKLGLLHGKLKAEEKNKIVHDFKKGKIDVLVSTPVVEVGIDVSNASIMLIEAAERFGLAQLHQLRGRVGRGVHKSYCLLFTEVRSQRVNQRLKALQSTLSGFELAELDLKLRGPGEVFGLRQHGFPELKIASWNEVEMIKNAKILAEKLIKDKKSFKKIAKELNLDQVVLN